MFLTENRAVVTDEFIGANINQHSVKMTVKNIVPYFLSTFLNCKYGYSQSTRHVVGITRPALDYSAIKSFLIPDLDRKFQENDSVILFSSRNIKSRF